jgi:hypothetical protein
MGDMGPQLLGTRSQDSFILHPFENGQSIDGHSNGRCHSPLAHKCGLGSPDQILGYADVAPARFLQEAQPCLFRRKWNALRTELRIAMDLRWGHDLLG